MTENADKYFKELQTARDKRMKKLLVREQNELIKIYSDAFTKSFRELCDSRRLGESTAVQQAKAAYTKQLYNELNTLCMKYNKKATQAATTSMAAYMKNVHSDYDADTLKEISKKANIVNKWAVDQIVKGSIYKDGKSLSDRIWRVSEDAGKQIHDAIASMIAQGKGAAEMSQTLKQFGLGGHRTWDRKKIKEKLGPGYARSYGRGLDYEALRLARTTLNHTSQLATMNLDKINPYAGAVRWRSDHTNGKTCELCISRATDDHEGLGPGIYLLAHVPFDHPNGYCHLENVFLMNGKIVSPTEMAKDIGKWIKGQPNSGMMDKLYGDIPVDKQWLPKTTKKKNSVKKEPPIVNNNSTTIEDLLKSKARDLQSLRSKKYMDGIAKALDSYPDNLKKAYIQAIDRLGYIQAVKDKGSYFWNYKDMIQIDIDDLYMRKARYKISEYNTLFHELGHAVDAYLNSGSTLSTKLSFIRAMQKDYKYQQDMLRQKMVDEYTAKGKRVTLEQIPTDVNSMHKLYNKYIGKNDMASGIQDIVGALSGKNLKWGHSQDYWDRNNRTKEAASELWADIAGSYADQESKELMEEYFPNSVKEFNKLIDENLIDEPENYEDWEY